MIGLIQRVTQAQVVVEQQAIGTIQQGLMVLFCAEQHDTAEQVQAMAHKLVQLRIFSDEHGKMNLALRDLPAHQLLIVPQFTLAADCRKGNRPSFQNAAPPQSGERLFNEFCQTCETLLDRPVARGQFGAHMDVHLCNSGPATFILRF